MVVPGGDITFWRAAPALARYVWGYHRYVSTPAAGTAHHDVLFPSWASLRFTVAGDDWSLRLGRRHYDPMPRAALFGPSSRAGYAEAGRATMFGIGLTPLGWSGLFGGDAGRYADRVLPVAEALPAAAPLARLAEGPAPVTAFDAWLLERLARRRPVAPEVETLLALLGDPSIRQVRELVERTGMDQRRLATISRRNFGFTPKLLLRRARFLRAVRTLDLAPRGQWAEVARAAGYWDGSHFLRDCHLFLDRPLGAFLTLEKPLNRAAAQLRAQVTGTPMTDAAAHSSP